MSTSVKSIGGYFELEVEKGTSYYPGLLALNTGRNAFEYILSVRQYHSVYIPYYTCDVMLEPLAKLGINYKFYHIDEKLEIKGDIIPEEKCALLYTNYFGLKDDYISRLVTKADRVIIDNSQAFYSRPIAGVDTFYSARKFFGVPDGAYVSINQPLNKVLEKDTSFDRCSHLLKRLDVGAEFGYPDFKANDDALANKEIMIMSDLTKSLLDNIKYDRIKEIRRANFEFLNTRLKSTNLFNALPETLQVPMIYPYLSNNEGLKDKLHKNRVYVATYWPNVISWTNKTHWEHFLAERLICIPVDQRYNTADMEYVVSLIREHA